MAVGLWEWLQSTFQEVMQSPIMVKMQEYAEAAKEVMLPYWEGGPAKESAFAVFTVMLVLYCMFRGRRKKTSQIPHTLSIFDLAKTANEPGHSEQVIKLLEKYNYDINFQIPSSGLNLFLCACLSGDRKLLKYMLKKGADVTICSKEGDGALYLATFGLLSSKKDRPHLGALEDLIRAGCDVNAKNASGYTPLHRAASKGNVTLVNLLLHHGADPRLCNNAGIYPMDIAFRGGHYDAADRLTVERPHREQMAEPAPPATSSPHQQKLMQWENNKETAATEASGGVVGAQLTPPPHQVLESPLPRRNRPLREGLQHRHHRAREA